jgi:hypothetical protein
VVEQLEKERNMRQELERVLESMRIPHGELELTKENDKLKQEIAMLREESKSPRGRWMGEYGRSLSKSKSNRKTCGSKSQASSKKTMRRPASTLIL